MVNIHFRDTTNPPSDSGLDCAHMLLFEMRYSPHSHLGCEEDESTTTSAHHWLFFMVHSRHYKIRIIIWNLLTLHLESAGGLLDLGGLLTLRSLLDVALKLLEVATSDTLDLVRPDLLDVEALAAVPVVGRKKISEKVGGWFFNYSGKLYTK